MSELEDAFAKVRYALTHDTLSPVEKYESAEAFNLLVRAASRRELYPELEADLEGIEAGLQYAYDRGQPNHLLALGRVEEVIRDGGDDRGRVDRPRVHRDDGLLHPE